MNNRMGFIVDLFRSSQRENSLFDEPFHPAQRKHFESGRMPEGKL
ncbi:MAG: hypothetical protein QM756_18475 [Polyangiaceae bacterium]